MEITLAKDVEDFLQEQIREGVCADASDLVNNVLRAVRDQGSNPFIVTAELEAWLLQAANKPTTPVMLRQDFFTKEIRRLLHGGEIQN